ncbi:hypothetical protein BHE74_00018719 [Ensete ventricosum]|nr:hypothetical protein BHE74_00018719 [Ensete ventricosum]
MPLIPRRRRRRHVATKVMTRGVTRLRVAHPMVRGAEVRCGCRVTAMTSGRRSIPEVRKGRRRRLGCRLDRAEESSGSALYRSRLEYMGCVARAVSRPVGVENRVVIRLSMLTVALFVVCNGQSLQDVSIWSQRSICAGSTYSSLSGYPTITISIAFFAFLIGFTICTAKSTLTITGVLIVKALRKVKRPAEIVGVGEPDEEERRRRRRNHSNCLRDAPLVC